MWQLIMSRAAVLLAVIAGLASPGAEAQIAATIADVRCVIVGMRLAGETSGVQQSQAALLTWYYLGRLDGRAPSIDVEKLLVQETTSMTDSDYISETKRCTAKLAEKGRQVTKIGKDLSVDEQTSVPKH